MFLNGAKNNLKIVTKIMAVRPKGRGLAQGPLNTPLVRVRVRIRVRARAMVRVRVMAG